MSMTRSADSALDAEGALTSGPRRSSAPVGISGHLTVPRRPGPPPRCERSVSQPVALWVDCALTHSFPGTGGQVAAAGCLTGWVAPGGAGAGSAACLRAPCANSYVTEVSGRPCAERGWWGFAGLLLLAVVVAMAGCSTAAWGRPVRAAGGDLGWMRDDIAQGADPSDRHRVVASPLTGTDLTAGLAVPAASVVSRAVFIAGR